MVYRVRKQWVEEGLEAVLSRKAPPRPSVPRIFDGEKEARLIALASRQERGCIFGSVLRRGTLPSNGSGSRLISAQKANTGNSFSLGTSARGEDSHSLRPTSFRQCKRAEASTGRKLVIRSTPASPTATSLGSAQLTLLPQTPQPSAHRRIRWSASGSAALMSSAAASLSIKAASESAALASAAIRHALIT